MGACVCTGGKCYVIGGEVQPSEPMSVALKINSKKTTFRTDIYDIASDSWSLGAVRLSTVAQKENNPGFVGIQIRK